MRVYRNNRRGLTLAATAALLTATAWGAAAAAAPDGTHPAPGGVRHAAAGAASRPTAATTAASPGWRVIKKFGPDLRPESGMLAAPSASDAWAVFTGSISFVEHWTDGAWRPVTMPPKVAATVFAPVAIGADATGDVWLFMLGNATEAVRHTGGKWVLQRIPAWVLRPANGPLSVTAAVFGPRNVWVFSLGHGAYAAHYNGHAWAKVPMPEVPDDVSAAGPADIWALGQNISFVMHWNGAKWVKVRVPVLPLPFGAAVSYSNIAAIGPRDAWMMRTISYKSGPPTTEMMRWNGKAWLTPAPGPADIIDNLVPDGHGGLWAVATDINPSGFWFVYHLAGSHWTKSALPSVLFKQYAEQLTWIPGTRSVWATSFEVNAKGEYSAVILKFGP